MKQHRLAAEKPDALAALEQVEENLRVVDGALRTATSHVQEVGRDLPEPEDGGKVEIGHDGLRRLSPSQFAEATAR